MNKIYSSRSLVSEATVAAAGAAIEAREIDRLVVVGRTSPQVVFEIMGRKGELTPDQLLLRTRYCEGLAAYRARNWDEARRAFNAAIEAGKSPQVCIKHLPARFRTTKTRSRHRPDRKPAAEQSVALQRCAILSVGGAEVKA